MSAQVERAMSQSASAFRDTVWPVIGPRIGGGELVPVESVTDSEFARRLDMQAGIDGWIFYGDTHMRGLACRVQWFWRRRFDTFSIRTVTDQGNHVTEYPKRRKALATPGAIVPWLTVQAYLRCCRPNGPCSERCPNRLRCPLASVAAAREQDVIACVDHHIGHEEPNKHGGRMWVVSWRELDGAGARVVIWTGEEP